MMQIINTVQSWEYTEFFSPAGNRDILSFGYYETNKFFLKFRVIK